MTTILVNRMLVSSEYQTLAQAWDAGQITRLELQRRILMLQRRYPVERTVR